jgi:CheY-like chemotaxis protein
MRKPNDAIRRPRPKAGPRRVLLVEDDTAVRTLARRLLQDEGTHGDRCANRRAGLARWQEAMSSGETIDVVVTDIVMPNMGDASS